MLKGFGVVFDNTSHQGQIIPLPLIVFDDNLSLSNSSNIFLQLIDNSTSTQIIVGSSVYLDGILEIEFEPFNYWSGLQFLLIDSANLVGKFTSVKSTCSSIFKVNYTSTSVYGSFINYGDHLNELSYISPTCNDDPCCGTSSNPCASFKGVIGTMGRKGRIYFYEGSYSFSERSGSVSDVDWEVIGIGDVMIEGMGETLFEILLSNFTLSNIDICCTSLICFSLSDSSFQLSNSTVFHDTGSSTIAADSSTVFLSNCVFELNSLNFLNANASQLLFINVTVSGLVSTSSIILVSSGLELLDSYFLNIQSEILFQLIRSDLLLNNTFCSNSNFSIDIFDLYHSDISHNEFLFESVNTPVVFTLKSSTLNLHDISVSPMVLFDQFVLSENSDIILSNLSMFDVETASSIIYTVNSNILLLNNSYRNINCTSLIESVTSVLELTDVTTFDVSCDICFNITRGNVHGVFMDVYGISGTLFLIFNVEFMDVKHLNIYGSFSDTVIAAQNTRLNLTDVSVFTSELNNLLDLKDSTGVCHQLLVDNSIVSDLFDLIDTDLTFTDLLLTNTSVDHVYLVQNSSIVVNDFTLENVGISDAFLFSIDSTIFINFITCKSTRFDDSFGLFTQINGSLTASNINLSYSSGPVFVLNNVNSSAIEFVNLLGVQSDAVFHVVQSHLIVADALISHSNVNRVFQMEKTHVFVRQFQSHDVQSVTVFNGSLSVVNLKDFYSSSSFTFRFFELSQSTLEISSFKLNDSIISSEFMLAKSSTATLVSLDLSVSDNSLHNSNDVGDVFLFNLNRVSFVLIDSIVDQVGNNLFYCDSTNVSLQTVLISRFSGSSIFNAFDSYLDLLKITLIQCNANLFLTCLQCNGSMNNLLVNDSTLDALFELNTVSLLIDTIFLSEVQAVTVFDTVNSNITIRDFQEHDLQLSNDLIYSRNCIVLLQSITLYDMSVASTPLFIFVHSELTVISFFLSGIKSSIFSFNSSLVNMSKVSLQNSNVPFALFVSDSDVYLSDSVFHSTTADVLVIIQNLSNVTFTGSEFSSNTGGSVFSISGSVVLLEFLHFQNSSSVSFAFLNSSSFYLFSNSFVELEFSQSLMTAINSDITISLIEIVGVMFRNFCHMNCSKFDLDDVVFNSSVVSFQSFLIGHDVSVLSRKVYFDGLSTSSNHPLIALTRSTFDCDLVSFSSLSCTLLILNMLTEPSQILPLGRLIHIHLVLLCSQL
ncbi:hypothetical protein GEMRC1_005796 [Eukaryota sp. GEM-RC1]